MRGFTCVPGPPSGRGSLVLWGSRASVVLILGARVLGHLVRVRVRGRVRVRVRVRVRGQG